MPRVIYLLSTACVILATALPPTAEADDAINLRLTLRDTETGELVPGRITLEQRPVGGPHVYHFADRSLSKNPDGKPALTMQAHVYADEASARSTAEFLTDTETRKPRSHVWHRDDLVIVLNAATTMTDEEFDSWVNRIDSRLR